MICRIKVSILMVAAFALSVGLGASAAFADSGVDRADSEIACGDKGGDDGDDNAVIACGDKGGDDGDDNAVIACGDKGGDDGDDNAVIACGDKGGDDGDDNSITA